MNTDKDKDSKDMVKELYADNVEAVRRFVFSLCRGNDDANDVVQETYLTALRKAPQFVPGTKFLNWIFSIARFKFLEHSRSVARAEQHLSRETLDALANETENNPFYSANELTAQKVQALRKCTQVLSQRNQDYLRLRYEEGLKPAAIALRYGLKPETIHHALSKARAFLKNCVETNLREEPFYQTPSK